MLDICQDPADAETKILCETRFEKVSRRYRAILNERKKELPERPPRKGKKSPIPKPEAEKLLLAFVDYKDQILRFAKRREVPFTNNRSERDLRMVKVKQKNPEYFETSLTLKLTAAFPAACSRCPAKAATRLPRCKSHSTPMRW